MRTREPSRKRDGDMEQEPALTIFLSMFYKLQRTPSTKLSKRTQMSFRYIQLRERYPSNAEDVGSVGNEKLQYGSNGRSENLRSR